MGSFVDWRNKIGNTAMAVAVSANNYKIVELLLSNKANPNLLLHNDNTYLMIACEHGYSEIVKLLLFYKANPNIYNYYLNSPLILASKNNFGDIVALLLQYDKDVYHLNLNDDSAFTIAFAFGHINVMNLFP